MRVFHILAAVILALCAPAWAESTPHVAVTGVGEVSRAPDMAVVTLGVTHRAEQASTAMSAVSRDLAAITRVLTEAGVEPRDIQTRGLRIDPVWQHRNLPEDAPPRIMAFTAAHGLTVRLRDLDRVADVLGRAIAAGANDFGGIQFDLQDRAAPIAEARRAAVSDAAAKAALYAGAAGVSLGGVRSISDVPGSFDPVSLADAPLARMAQATAVPISEGELTIRAQVNIVYDLN